MATPWPASPHGPVAARDDGTGFDRGRVNHPERDKRVGDPAHLRHDRRAEAEAMIRLWLRSAKPDAGDEVRFWRRVLRDVERQVARSGRPS